MPQGPDAGRDFEHLHKKGSSKFAFYLDAPVLYHGTAKGVIQAPWGFKMIDRSLRRQFAVFLSLVGCLSLSLQTEGPLSFTEPITRTLRCVEASLVTASTLPTDTAGDGTCSDECSSPESLFFLPGLPGIPLSQHRCVLSAASTSLPEGFPAEIYRPPIAAV